MDIYTKLANNMESIVKSFGERVEKCEQEIQASAPKNVSSLASEFLEFKSLIWKCLSMLRSQLELLTLGLDRHETAARRKVLLVHGVKEEIDEQPGMVLKTMLANQLKVSAECLGAIRVVHRLGPIKDTKTRPLLVRFTTLEARSEVWGLKKGLKGSGMTVTEFLTKSRHNVFVASRKHFGMNNAWTSEGKIIIVLPDKSRRKVESWGDLQPLTSEYPSMDRSQPSQDKGKKPAAGATANAKKGGGVVTRRGGQVPAK